MTRAPAYFPSRGRKTWGLCSRRARAFPDEEVVAGVQGVHRGHLGEEDPVHLLPELPPLQGVEDLLNGGLEPLVLGVLVQADVGPAGEVVVLLLPVPGEAVVAEGEEGLRRLAARVVNVVEDQNLPARVGQDAGDGVPQGDVAQVAHVELLVGVHRGVLHQDHPGPPGEGGLGAEGLPEEGLGAEAEVQVPPHGDGLLHELGQGKPVLELVGDGLGRLPQLLGQGEKGDAVVPRFVLGGPGHLEAGRNPHLL